MNHINWFSNVELACILEINSTWLWFIWIFLYIIGFDLLISFFIAQHFIVWIYHTLFIHSSVDRHLSCFCFLLLWIKLQWTFVCRFLYGHRFSIFLGIYLVMELLDHMVNLYLIYWEAARLFYKVAAPYYNPTKDVWELQFFYILVNTCYCQSSL